MALNQHQGGLPIRRQLFNWAARNPQAVGRGAYQLGRAMYQYGNYGNPSPPRTPRNRGTTRPSRGDWSRNPRYTKGVNTFKKKRGHKKKKLVLVSKKQVKKWNKAAVDANTDLSKYEHRYLSTHIVTCAANKMKFDVCYNFDATVLEAMLNAVPYANKDGLMTNRNPTSLTYDQVLKLKMFSTGTWYNNYAVPVWVNVYIMTPEEDTSTTPLLAYADGMTSINQSDQDNVLCYPSQSPILRTLWKNASTKQVCLQPGESVSLSLKRSISYDPATQDASNLSFRKAIGAHQYLVRVQGALGHGVSVATNVGTSIAGVDFKCSTSLKMKYDSGAGKVENISYTTSALGAQTGGTVIGWATNAENTAYNAGL